MIGARMYIRGGNRHAILVGTLMMTTALASTLPAVPGRAQQAASSQPMIAQLQLEQSFDIAAQPLTDALVAFGRQSGVQVTVDGAVARTISAPAVRGTMTREQVLRRLLADSGLSYTMSGSTVAIERPGGDGVTTLGPINVEGRLESAYGPVDGYVATRSATGTKTDTPLIETPRSVSVIPADQIESQNVTNIGSAFRYTPGIYGEERGAVQTRTSLVVRGFISRSAVSRDGMLGLSDEDARAEPDVYGLERVELLRGPASVLYGQGFPGGIVGTVTKRPTETFFAEAEVNGGSFDKYGGKFDIGGPLDEDKQFLFRLTGVAHDGETQVDFTQDKRVFVAPALTWRPGPDTNLTILSHYRKDETQPEQFLPGVGTVLPNPHGEFGTSLFTGEPGFNLFDRESYALGYLFDHKWNDAVTLRHNARYARSEVIKQEAFGSMEADNRTLTRRARRTPADNYSFASDTHVQTGFGIGESEHAVLAGIDYRFVDANIIDFRSAAGTVGALDLFNPVYGAAIPELPLNFFRETKTTQLGVYLQDQVKLADKVVVTLGGRHDWADQKRTDRITGVTTKLEDTEFTGQAGLTYLFDNGIAPYASYAESFEPQSGTDVSGNVFQPTTGTQYEAGIKYQPSPDFLLTAAAYELTRQNVTTSDPANPGFSIQTGEVRSRGIELESRVSPIDGLNLIAGYSYTDSEVTKSNGTDLGKRPTRIPDHIASLWADYTIQSGSFDGLGFGAGVRHIGATEGDSDNTFDVPAHTLADAAIFYDIEDGPLNGFRLSINATNLFDKTFVSECEARNSCLYGARRTVTGSVKYRW